MVLIENEGAIFRGPARGLPYEVWSFRDHYWKPYADAGQLKPVEWGSLITEAEFEEFRREDAEYRERDAG